MHPAPHQALLQLPVGCSLGWLDRCSVHPSESALLHGGEFLLLPAWQGHMVPMDKPKNALDMITSFTRGKPLAPSRARAQGAGALALGRKEAAGSAQAVSR